MTTQIAKPSKAFTSIILAKGLRRLSRWLFPAAVAALFLTVATQRQVRAAESFTGVVNLNTATPEELQHLPGVGPSKAKRIVDHRTHKPFRTVAELVRVKGFGAKTMSRLRPFLTTTAPTTVGATTTSAGTCACACDSNKSSAQAVALPSVLKPTPGAKR